MLARKHIQRQIAVLIVIAVIKAPFLLAVNRKIGGVDIQYNLFGCFRLCF